MHRNVNFYNTMWNMVLHHNFSIEGVWDLLPWEFDSLVTLTDQYVELQVMKQKQMKATQGN